MTQANSLEDGVESTVMFQYNKHKRLFHCVFRVVIAIIVKNLLKIIGRLLENNNSVTEEFRNRMLGKYIRIMCLSLKTGQLLHIWKPFCHVAQTLST